ncbi:EFR1 family ferrodoxin [Intestinibacter sp.]|uniref:EFR1 family ferrodoxin n=1 Tax=Intestinibacter sp. TaxID=1965304 RepID=UPI003F159021
MNNIILYFTGTGNTLHVAKKIALGISDNIEDTTLLRITANMKNIDFSKYDRIGIFSPAYMGGLPLMVKEFLEKVNIPNEAYVYSVVTCGGMEAATLSQIKKILSEKGNTVSASFTFTYPSNNQTSYAPSTEEQSREIIKKTNCEIEKAIDIIKLKQKNSYKSNPVMEMLAKAAGATFKPRTSDKEFWVEDTCTSCGLCAKVCPADNIKLIDGSPQWQHHCERCTACLQLCPKQAIQFKENTKKWGRYCNPEISINDLMIQN